MIFGIGSTDYINQNEKKEKQAGVDRRAGSHGLDRCVWDPEPLEGNSVFFAGYQRRIAPRPTVLAG